MNLENFNIIKGEELNDILFQRYDTKYLCSKDQIDLIFKNIHDHYDLVSFNGNAISENQTVYFDTHDKKFYNWHHNKKSSRYKIRIRKYPEASLKFLEWKSKKNNKTDKQRVSIENEMSKLDHKDLNGFGFDLNEELNQSLKNQFNRITLLNNEQNEKITIDNNIVFWKENDSFEMSEEHFIIEIKQKKLNRKSPLKDLLRNNMIRPIKFSKYVFGLSTLDKSLKNNRFKKLHLQLNRLDKKERINGN